MEKKNKNPEPLYLKHDVPNDYLLYFFSAIQKLLQTKL